MVRIEVLAVGSIDCRTSNSFGLQPREVDLRCVGTMNEAASALQQGFAPSLIVVAERWPQDISLAAFQRLGCAFTA